MEYDKIKMLMEDMSNSKLSEINIDFPDGTRISMKKENEKENNAIPSNYIIQTKGTEMTISEKTDNNNIIETKEGNIVKSPMVGTFYLKPSPTSDPYVEIGNTIKSGDTLCIIEAMKLMNEIESEFSGKLVEIYVKDGETVEYGTPLFRIEN